MSTAIVSSNSRCVREKTERLHADAVSYTHLFDYADAEGDPQTTYAVAGGLGQLDISQTQPVVHMGGSNNSWQLRFASNVPLDLSLDMGCLLYTSRCV